MSFIPAAESPLFIRTFRLYVKACFRYRFKNIWIRQSYVPGPSSRTVYFMNHTSWWDGLIPFLLNEYRFNQRARAFMKLEQMKKYPFFKWMGVFSIDSADRAHTLQSLRYAVESMKRSNSSLFIFPEGDIKPMRRSVTFRPGTAWLYQQLPDVDFVPVGIHMQTVRFSKPELHIWVDEPVAISGNLDSTTLTSGLERTLNNVLGEVISTAGFDDEPYELF